MKDLVINTQLPIINVNYQEVKVSIEESLKKYQGIVVTESGLKDCKSTQKELAGLRKKIDDYRKSVKKEMESPIKFFEGQCKDLINLVDKVESPIKEGIIIFDNKRREEKRFQALEIIKDSIELNRLEKKYAIQLTVLDKYLNLSASKKSMVEDIEQRADMIRMQQDADKVKFEMLKVTIEATLETVNATIKTPLKYENFEKYIGFGWDAAKIVREINERATLVRNAEKPIEEKRNIEMPIELKDLVNKVKKDENKFFVDIHVEHNGEMIQGLSKFLKDNGYMYEVKNKGRVGN